MHQLNSHFVPIQRMKLYDVKTISLDDLRVFHSAEYLDFLRSPEPNLEDDFGCGKNFIREGVVCKTRRKHHVAQPPDHLGSSFLDTECILIVSTYIFFLILKSEVIELRYDLREVNFGHFY